MKNVTLELVSTAHAKRGGEPFTDYKVGRILLSRHLDTTLIGALDQDRAYARQLLCRESSALPSGRVPLFVCEMCADLDCGAVSVMVTRVAGGYIWSEFAYEAACSEAPSSTAIMDRLGPFRFEEAAYESVLLPYC